VWWSASRPGVFTPVEKICSTHWIGNWVEPHSLSGHSDWEKNSFPVPAGNRTSVIQPVTSSLHWLVYSGSSFILLLRWLYSPMRTFASLMDFSQSSLLTIWLFRGHILSFLTVDFFRSGVVSPTHNPQPEGPGLHIYIPWRLGGPVIPPGTEYPF
jgi:hypothetical protein